MRDSHEPNERVECLVLISFLLFLPMCKKSVSEAESWLEFPISASFSQYHTAV